MPDGYMHFLDSGRVVRRDYDRQIRDLFYFTAIIACQSNSLCTKGIGLFQGPHNIFRVATGADSHYRIVFLGQGLDLSFKNRFKTIIVSKGCQ